MSRHALVVMAKQPLPGRAKTRLSPPLSPEEAAALAECLLRDTLDLMAAVPEVSRVIAYHPPEAGGYFAAIAPAGFRCLAQVGADLGARLDHALASCLAEGHGCAAAIGADSPSLPPGVVAEAFAALEGGADVALGPAEDGGYYLVGLRRPCPALFRVAMSTPTVLAETLAIARREGLAVALLPPWFDVDAAADLARLGASLAECPPEQGRRTRAFLAALAGRGG